MMIERLNGRPALAAAAAGLLLVLVVGWFGFVSPQRSKVAELDVQISDTETQLAVTEAVARQGPTAQNSKDLATLRTAIPDATSMPQVLRQLTRAAAAGNIAISGITPGAPVANGVANTIPLSLTLEGSYFGIREFLRQLRTRADMKGESLRATGRLYSVESIQFTGGSDTGGRINATVAMSAYAFNTPPSSPGAASTVSDEPPTEAAGG
jgi:Tfp pilus assembly protein PilO